MESGKKRRKPSYDNEANVENFLKACSEGRSWMVKRCLAAGIDVHARDDAALSNAVVHGRTYVVKLLLLHGADPNSNDVLTVAGRDGHPAIVFLLIDHGADGRDGRALKEAVTAGNTECVKILIDHGAQVQADLLTTACQNSHTTIVRMLLKAGADANVEDGRPLLEACDRGDADIVKLLVDHGADVEICDNEPLRRAAKKGHVNTMTILLEHGADHTVLQSVRLDDVSMSILKKYIKRSRIVRLRLAIKASLKKTDYKWQDLCAQPTYKCNIKELERQAKLFGITADDSTKTRLCSVLARRYEAQLADPVETEETDLSGNMIKSLPRYKILKMGRHYYNCFDLFRMLDRGMVKDPYTNVPMDVERVKAHRAFLRDVLTKERFKDVDLLQDVKTTPVFTDVMILRDRLLREVWNKLYYEPSVDIFMDASDSVIDDMVTKLYNLCEESHALYPMLTERRRSRIERLRGTKKKVEFLNLLSQISNMDDEEKSTRNLMLSILFKHYGTEDISDDNDDDLSFMVDPYYGEEDYTFYFGYGDDYDDFL